MTDIPATADSSAADSPAPQPTPEVTYEVREGVARITLAAPGRRNALSVEMSHEIIEAARTAEADPAVGAIVITGGPHFCSGAVREVLAAAGKDPAEDRAYRNLETIYRAFTSIGEIGLPTIAAVRGAAVGAGLNLALATDLRVVSTTARLLPGFAQIGIHPGGGHFTLLSRAGGREAAAAMGVFGEEIDGARAVQLGMAWAAVDDDQVESEAHRLAARVGRDPDLARRLVANFRRQTAGGGLPWDVAVEMERPSQMWSLRRR